MTSARFKIESFGDEVHTTFIVGDESWWKRYGSATDAATEAVELGIMGEQTKPFVEETLRQQTWLADGSDPARSAGSALIESVEPVEVAVDELRAHGFLPGTR